MPGDGADEGPYARRRAQLIAQLRERGHVRSASVEQAMVGVPREEFVPTAVQPHAYLDQPLAIGSGQTISAPHMVAIMTEALEVRPGHRILEVGTGSGYQAAVLSRLVGESGRVVTVERHAPLHETARAALERVGATNVTAIKGDGSLGFPPSAPYDRILVTAAAPKLPPPLVRQLAPDGILLAPVGRRTCELIRARNTSAGLEEESLGACAFVPLKGAHGHGLRFFAT